MKIGEFSKLSHLTVKALRFYEKEGLLIPHTKNEWNGYRYYETAQLEEAARIKSYRQLGLTIDEIKSIFRGTDEKQILSTKAATLQAEKANIDIRLSIINHILEEISMNYQVILKEVPEQIVYYSEIKLHTLADMMTVIPEIGAECQALNPGLKCMEPPYEFCEYLDKDHKDTDIRIRHSEAVQYFGTESGRIKFKRIPAVKVLSIFHKGPYEEIGAAYAYLIKYAEENSYKAAGLARECYIDGIWNKESPSEWLTEIQLPIE